jgi:putative transposase
MLVFETLNIKAMHQLWGRKVGDLGFADFLLKAQWMATKFGKDLVKIDRWDPTTKTWPLVWTRPGHAAQHTGLRLRRLRKHRVSRNVNASCNILEAGRRLRSGDTRKTSQEASVAVRKHITAESHGFSRGSASRR